MRSGSTVQRRTGRGSSAPTASTRKQPKRTGPTTASTSSSRPQSVAPPKSAVPSKSAASLRHSYSHDRTSEADMPSWLNASSGSSRGSTHANALNTWYTDNNDSGEDGEENEASWGKLDTTASGDEDEPGIEQALIMAQANKKNSKTGKETPSSTLKERLRLADEQAESIRQDLEEEQSRNMTLQQELAKRRREDAAEEETQAKRVKTSSETPKKNFTKAFEQGKQMSALYCPFGSRCLLFGALQQLLGGACSSEVDKENKGAFEEEEDEERNGDSFEQQMDCPEAASLNKSTPEGTYDFFEPTDQTAYIEDTARIFWQDVPPEDLEGWQTRAYQSRFMEGMSRGRSSFKNGTEQAELVFGFQVRQVSFAKKSTRAELPGVASLLDNTMFLSVGDKENVKDRIYRHGCLSQILMRVFHGPSALASGKKSKKARSTYQEQWGVTSISIELLARTATVATHILTGEDELNQSEAIRNIFWKQLHFLTEIKNTGGKPYDDLIRFYDARLGLLPADSLGNRLKPAEERLLAQVLGR